MGDVNIKQLQYFVAIAEEGQITAAAERLHVSQPPLSYELAKLEEELGTKLALRNSRGVALTDAGELLYKRALQILDMVGAVEHEVQQVGGGKQGTLSIGTISSSSNLIPNAFSSGFAVDAPDVRFAIHEGNTFEVLDMLKAGVVDLGIVRTPFKMAGLAGKLSEPEPMVAVSWDDAGAKGVQGRGTDEIRIAELDDVPVVIYRRFERLIRKAFDDAGCRLTVGCATDDARTALMWAHSGYGIALVPQRISTFFTQDAPCIRTLKCKDLVTRQALVWQEGRYLSPLAKRFIDLFPGEQLPAARTKPPMRAKRA